MQKVIKKYPEVITLLIIALAALAAPYLTSIDPDSRVFRSGVLSALLFLASYRPVKKALLCQRKTVLLYGALFGLIFAFFLGIGSELAVYGELLPGMGSMIRRFAVPLMAAPFMATLFSYPLGWEYNGQGKRRHLPWLPCFLLILACYSLFLLAYYPGIINYDFFTELQQYLGGYFYAAHPIYHTFLTGILFSLGNAVTGSYVGGAVLYCVVQMTLMAMMYAAVVRFVSKRVPLAVSIILLLFFALFPVHGFMAISTIKDALFTSVLSLLIIQLWMLVEEPDKINDLKTDIFLVLTCMLLGMLRHNAPFAYGFACLGILLMYHSWRARILVAIIVLLSAGIPSATAKLMNAIATPSSEMMSIPCQQLMRTANYADLSQEEFDDLNSWFSGQYFRYRPHSADPAKGGNFDYQRYVSDKGAFWRMYLEYGKRYPKIYIEAFLENCAGLWNPDDISHAHSLDTEDWDFVYTKTGIIFPEEIGIVKQTPILKRLHIMLEQIGHSSRHERLPIIALLFRPSIYVYAMVLLSFRTRIRHKKEQRLLLLPIWGIILSYVFSACILIRYAYAFMACAPVAVALVCFTRKKERAI